MIVDSENQFVITIIRQVHCYSSSNHPSDFHQPGSGVSAEESKASYDFCVTSVEFAFILIGLLYLQLCSWSIVCVQANL